MLIVWLQMGRKIYCHGETGKDRYPSGREQDSNSSYARFLAKLKESKENSPTLWQKSFYASLIFNLERGRNPPTLKKSIEDIETILAKLPRRRKTF